MRTKSIRCGVTAIVIAVAMAQPTPAVADPPGNDTVEVRVPGSATSTWKMERACPLTCVARIASSDGWRGAASLNNGTWSMSVFLGDWVRSSYPADPSNCVPSSDTSAPLTQSWSWNDTTLIGTLTTVSGSACGGPTTTQTSPFTITKAQ